MPFYERGDVRIHYSDSGSGFPLLLIPGGGLNSTIGFFSQASPFNAIEDFNGQYRCISMDLRNANGGQSSGPLEIERPWDAYADDQLGLMDHLNIREFMVMLLSSPSILNSERRLPLRAGAKALHEHGDHGDGESDAEQSCLHFGYLRVLDLHP